MDFFVTQRCESYIERYICLLSSERWDEREDNLEQEDIIRFVTDNPSVLEYRSIIYEVTLLEALYVYITDEITHRESSLDDYRHLIVSIPQVLDVRYYPRTIFQTYCEHGEGIAKGE